MGPVGDNGECTEKNGGWTKADSYICEKETSKSQTPIDLDPNLKLSEEAPIKLSNAAKYTFPAFSMKNNGHTFSMMPKNAQDAHFSNNVHQYNMYEFHFHWGPTDDCGSEHAFNGRSFSMELHLVHIRHEFGTDLVAALGDSTGLAVIGLLIQAVPGFTEKCIMDDIAKHYIDNKEGLSTVGKEVEIEGSGLSFKSILEEKGHVYHYKGSLTTPPCSEAVAWYVRREAVQCSPETIAKFRTAITEKGSSKPLEMSFRRLQRLNDRVVTLVPLNE
ncbi:Carbonic anhydrase 9 [Orchesella cincta]|uniref:carbonic anhydrase n=1 Tax=Orchesella cincta TaxID=48709 RepID=A0A1D2MPZ3_ORCCI|nr:Carbonic anhydrase 9 [Orchesella cincta]